MAWIATGVNGYNSKTDDPVYELLGGFSRCKMTYFQWNCVSLDNNWNGDVKYPERADNDRLVKVYGKYPLDKVIGVKNNYEKQYGYFLSTKFEPINNLKVILGTRYNHYETAQKYNGPIYDKMSVRHDPKDKWIPYAGLVYSLTDNTSAYASYTGIYKTQLEKDINDQFRY